MRIRIRRILVPVLFCLAVACLIELPLAETTIFGKDVILWDTLFRAISAVPVLLWFYREDKVFRGEKRWGIKEAALCVLCGASLSLLSGAFLKLFGRTDYQEAAGNLLTETLWLKYVVLLVASPMLEELFFRGILYQRLKELCSSLVSALFSAFLFGVYHGNFSQGIYGFFMGLVLACSMEKCQTVQAPIMIHLAANLAALLCSGNYSVPS